MNSIGHFTETERTAAINISNSGSNQIIVAPGDGKRIYIDHINFLSAGTTTVQLFNGVTALSGSYSLQQGGAVALDNSGQLEHGILECDNNAAFNITLGSAISVQGFVRYRINNE